MAIIQYSINHFQHVAEVKKWQKRDRYSDIHFATAIFSNKKENLGFIQLKFCLLPSALEVKETYRHFFFLECFEIKKIFGSSIVIESFCL